MIGDFDGGADDLWALYGKVAKGHDEAQIQTMKEQMKDVFLPVRLYLDHPITGSVMLMLLSPTGYIILRRPHRFRTRRQAELEGQPCRSNGLLPPTTFCPSRPNFPANLLHRSPGLDPLHPSTSLPCFRTIGLRHFRKLSLVHGSRLESGGSTPRAAY